VRQEYTLFNDKQMPYYFLNFDRAAAEPIMEAAAAKRAEREKALEVCFSYVYVYRLFLLCLDSLIPKR
jgi:hypothetical protein